ncbi:MarR family winged helix-turn-helix transcriptional regulator [Kineococcus rubinsiae]|uniref:MarR family winged helix-turn-helix transcriptional regulator n=1 Tax=Kineococcus rubinsiae TaxID=2609562 RepID=UPI0014304493|nr:MarR family transcriptional regulator [Kineococcus rubinsiae]NIZ90080.1 MarR family transcriptional regulator [Kineococcus rubinsiae]
MTDPRQDSATVAVDGPPRWLTTDEQVAWRGLVELSVKLPALLDANLQREAAVTNFEYGVLARLTEEPAGLLRMSALAQDCNGSLSRLSHAAKRLEGLGLIERSTDPADGRYTIATLTEAGRRKVVEAAPGHVRTVLHHVIEPLTPEQLEQLTEIARAVLARIDPASPFLCGSVTSRGTTPPG